MANLSITSYKLDESSRINYANYTAVQKHILHPFAVFGYPFSVVAKSTTSRRKLNNLSLANSSTPFKHRAFFVRSLRTPKINPVMDLFSMVERKGQPLAVGCIPVIAVFLPLYVLPPVVGKLAVVLKKYSLELLAMIYKFLVLGEKRLTIRIRANSEKEARQQLQFTRPALCVARFHDNGGIYA